MSVEAVVAADVTERNRRANAVAFGVMVALIAIAPFVAYPFFIMQALCFALFACAFNLLIGYVNLLSLGHAMFLGLASYVCAHAAKVWGLEPVSAIAARRRWPRPRSASSPARSPSARAASISR